MLIDVPILTKCCLTSQMTCTTCFDIFSRNLIEQFVDDKNFNIFFPNKWFINHIHRNELKLNELNRTKLYRAKKKNSAKNLSNSRSTQTQILTESILIQNYLFTTVTSGEYPKWGFVFISVWIVKQTLGQHIETSRSYQIARIILTQWYRISSIHTDGYDTVYIWLYIWLSHTDIRIVCIHTERAWIQMHECL